MTEEERLRSLRDLMILDSEPEPLFSSLARLAAEVCGTPIALMSLIDERRQWFKANIGLPGVNETPRDLAFCARAIEAGDVFEVPDASLDSRFAGNPMVTGSPGIRFYAGAPLLLADGARVGTLCVIDREPRVLDAGQAAMLKSLAGLASEALAMRQDLLAKAFSARTEYERQLAESEEMHRAIVEAQSELVSLAEQDGTLLYVGPAYARHFGLTPEAMRGANLFDFVDAADRESVRRLVGKVFATREPYGNENRMVSAEGAERWISWKNSVYIDASGRALLHSTGRDVTERRNAEAGLRSSQSLLLRTGWLTGVGGWELDMASGRLLWSDQTRRIHEVDDDFVPTVETAVAFYAPEVRATIDAALRAGIEHGTPWELDLPMVTAMGRRIWVRAMGEVERENGIAVRLLGAFADITQRKLLAERLDASERFVRQVTDNLPVGIAYVDRTMRYRFVNIEHCRRFGQDREDIIGHTREELTGRPYSPAALAVIEATFAGVAQRVESEETVGGNVRLLDTQMIPDLAADGSAIGLYAVSSDITERSATEKRLRELTAILENTPDFVVQTDWRGAVTYMNPAARRFCGLAPDESVEGRNSADFNAAETHDLMQREILPAIEARGMWSGEARMRGVGGAEVPVSHMVVGHRPPGGRIERYSAVLRDISPSVAARKDLQAQTSALRAVMEAIPAIVAVVGVDGRVRIVNTAYERWTGVERSLAVGQPLADAIGPEGGEGARPWLEQALAGETGSYERVVESAAGSRHIAGNYSPLRAGDGTLEGFIAVAHDVTVHRREEGRLLRLAQRDPLTGLLNRAGFAAEAEQLILATAPGDRLALLCIDLDHFKPVNDSHGHAVGDAVLRAFAQRMVRLVRPTDIVARLGGDEFAILLSAVRADAVGKMVADKVVAAAREPFDVAGLRLAIGASVGVSFRADPGEAWSELLARADAMLYQAKGAGRGRQAS